MTHNFAVEAKGIEKSFGNTRALHGVDLQIDVAQCLGLVGRNGAGKSTLVSILCGLLKPDAGQVYFHGQPAPQIKDIAGWHDQIATVFQHSKVVPQLTVAENVFLGNSLVKNHVVDWKVMREKTRAIIDEWNFDVSVNARCETLTVEQLQIVEIVRALATGAQCILLDEPTAALERKAVERLFDRVNQLVANGVAVLYISHHLEEVFEICRDVTVLRDGEVVLNSAVADINKEQMVAAMVGELAAVPQVISGIGDLIQETGVGGDATNRSGLVVEELFAKSSRGELNGVSLSVGAGERVGVTGLLGAGVVTLGRVVAGSVPFAGGRITVNGRALVSGRRDLALANGVGYVPENRQAEGFVAHLGVAENTTMTIVRRLSSALGFLNPHKRELAAAPITKALSLVSSGPKQPVGELSGGNQQKVTVMRSLISNPSVIVAVTPTRGVDVASKALLLASLTEAARSTGAGLLLCSDEFDDLDECDRVIVLFRGKVFAEYAHPPFDREALIAATEGLTIEERTAS
ncbi:MAG: sugar ABC transporter ATP-binding protein [Acidimicrobiales bacterium]